MSTSRSHRSISPFVTAFMLAAVSMNSVPVFGQLMPASTSAERTVLSATVEQALSEANRSSAAQFALVERQLRDVFRQARNRESLKRFVSDAISTVEKLRQAHDRVANPGATDTRVAALFRSRIMDEETVCRLLDQSLRDFCRVLDQQDQALLIKLKIDREASRTELSRSVIDPASFKKPITTAVSSAVASVQNDFARSVVSLVASEAISMGVKRAARDLGVMPGEQGSFADFLGGLIVDIGVSMAVDAATDPTPQMVADLDKRLSNAEREILDGSASSPGYLTLLRRVTEDRTVARRKLIEAELQK